MEAGTLQADRLKNREAKKSASGAVEKVPNMMAVSNIHLQVIKVKVSHLYSAVPQIFHRIKGALQ